MNKQLIAIMAIILLLVGGYFGYSYYNGPKIVDGVVSTTIDDHGKPVGITAEFSPEDTIYFSAKGNRFWVKKAQVVWYKGQITTANRFLVEEDVVINDAGYFSAKLSLPEGLEEGRYGVTIYSFGRDIIETRSEFVVKK